MASTQVQRRRGTTAQHAVFTGAVGEITVDTDKKTVVVHDGVTAGGFPLPTTLSDMLAILTNAEVSIAAAVVLTGTAFGKLHACTGTTVDYTVSLPAVAGNAGKFIGFRMDNALTKLVTLDANAAELIDGAATRVMWANETAILYCTGTAWVKLIGRSIAMIGSLVNAVNQSMSASTFTKVTIPTVVNNIGNIADGPTSRINIRRAGNYRILGQVYYVSGQTANTVLSRAYKNAATAILENEAGIFGTSSYLAPPLLGPASLAAGDYVELYGYHNSAAARNVFGTGCFLSLEEKLSW